MGWQTTTTLLTELREYNSDDAWRRFVGRFRRPLVQFMGSLGLSGADADDAAQETLVAFAESYRQGRYDRQVGRLHAWLFGIAYRQGLNARRRGSPGATRKAGQIVNVDAVATAIADERFAESVWQEIWNTAVLELCLAKAREEFAPQTFASFDMVVREGRSPADVAEVLGVPVKSVYNAKHRVLTRIRALRADLEAQE